MSIVKYTLSFPKPLTHFIEITLELNEIKEDKIELILPDWRPGRYELTNYVSNVKNFRIVDADGQVITSQKKANNVWEVDTDNANSILIKYSYYAHKMDAGSSWVDDEQIYVNFINCMLYARNHQELPIEVSLDLPENYDYCGALPLDGIILRAENYYELVDSPFLCSNQIKSLSYESNGKQFNIWIQGECPIDESLLVNDFKKFTDCQIDQMGGFPNVTYDFIIQSLPYKHYHGVEHKNSTVLVLGPNSQENKLQYYLDLLGVASHELFHTWNVTRIRPLELSPYDFSKENYYETGFATEGFTTYYGDLFLVRSQVFDRNQYFKELNIIFKRHFENYGRHHLSLVDSSFDLWIDGYKKLLPGRKVSIYVKGATVALMLDLSIREKTNSEQSLDNIINDLWVNFGQKEIGYSKDDVYDLIRKYMGDAGQKFIDDYYEGVLPVEAELERLLKYVGCGLNKIDHPESSAALFGFRVTKIGDDHTISEIAPNSPAEEVLSIGDVIKNVNDSSFTSDGTLEFAEKSEIELVRNNKQKRLTIEAGKERFYSIFEIKIEPDINAEKRENLDRWIGGS